VFIDVTKSYRRISNGLRNAVIGITVVVVDAEVADTDADVVVGGDGARICTIVAAIALIGAATGEAEHAQQYSSTNERQQQESNTI
jgi:hypothetical protein